MMKKKKMAASRGRGSSGNQIYGFQNFLQNKAFTAFNIAVDAQGVAEFSAELANYSTMLVFVCDKGAVAQKVVDLPANRLVTRNLSLANPLD